MPVRGSTTAASPPRVRPVTTDRSRPANPPRHVATAASCEGCHKSTTNFVGARLEHRSVTAACATCHNGTIAIGKPPRHIATSAPCDNCHKSTTSFAGVRVDHTALTAPCANCHNGTSASRAAARHFATTVAVQRLPPHGDLDVGHLSAQFAVLSAALGIDRLHRLPHHECANGSVEIPRLQAGLRGLPCGELPPAVAPEIHQADDHLLHGRRAARLQRSLPYLHGRDADRRFRPAVRTCIA